MTLWQIVLNGRFRLLQRWLAFVRESGVKTVSEDTWRQARAPCWLARHWCSIRAEHAFTQRKRGPRLWVPAVLWPSSLSHCQNMAYIRCMPCFVPFQVLDFTRCILGDMSNYDPSGAWPVCDSASAPAPSLFARSLASRMDSRRAAAIRACVPCCAGHAPLLLLGVAQPSARGADQ